MFTTKIVYNKNNHLSKDGTAPIYIRMTFKRKTKYYHTNIFIRPDQWSFEVINHKYRLQLNSDLQDMLFQAQKFYRDCRIKKIPFSLNKCHDAIGIDVVANDSFTSFITEAISNDESNVASSTHKKRLDVLKRLNGFHGVIYFDDIDYNFLIKFKNHLLKQDSIRGGKIGINYISSIFTIFKKYVNEAIKEGKIQTSPFNGFSIKKTATAHVVHDIDEIELIYSSVQDDYLEFTRLLYCFLLFTGVRYNDMFMLTKSNFQNGMIKFVAGKTKKSKGKLARIPLHLFDDRAQLIFNQFGFTIPYLSNGTFNKNIKKLMIRLDIDKYVTAHTARHSFKSLMLERGYSLSYIAEMMAHSSTKTTESYGSISDKALLK